jgi:hypothetical protein
MNSPFVIEQARELAKRLQESAGDDGARVRLAYALLFAREPLKSELTMAKDFLRQTASDTGAGMSGWEHLCQALLATNEMLYVD